MLVQSPATTTEAAEYRRAVEAEGEKSEGGPEVG
jgi:hypothetical protein